MRPIGQLMGGLAILLVAGCMSAGKVTHTTSCHFDTQAATAEPYSGVKQTAARLPDPPLADSKPDTSLHQPNVVDGSDTTSPTTSVISDDCCDPCSSGRCSRAAYWLPCRPQLSRPCFSFCGLGSGCIGRLYNFATYRPLCSAAPSHCCTYDDCTPPVYCYFEPSRYNKPLEPVNCCSQPWYCRWMFWKRSSCDSCIRPRCGGPVVPARAACESGACVARPQVACGAACRPRVSDVVANGANAIMARPTGRAWCSSGGCNGGAQACPSPKPRLDGLPILPPTMFRKYEPCNEVEGVNLMAPVPGTAVPGDQLPMNQTKKGDGTVVGTGWRSSR